MTIKNVFKCRMPSMNYVFSNGKYAQFIEGVFMTDIQAEVQELEKECKSGHPYIYIDENQTTYDTFLQDKMNEAIAEAKLKVLKEYEENQAKLASSTASPAQVDSMVTSASVQEKTIQTPVVRK